MSRISLGVLDCAVSRIRSMTNTEKEALADDIFQAQPNMLGSVIVQQQFDVPLTKIEFLLELLFICFQAMKESKVAWPLITEDEQDRQMRRFVGTVQFGTDLQRSLQDRVMKGYIKNHAEQPLLAFVLAETDRWLTLVEAEETDKYVLLAAINMVDCIAHVSLTTGSA